MKKAFSILIVVTALYSVSARAQTNSVVTNSAPATNIVQLLGLPPTWSDIISVIGRGLVDAAPYIPNAVADLEVGGLYNSNDKNGKFGGFADLTLPITQQTGVGLGGAYLNDQVLAANVNIKLGTTTTLPLLGPVYTYMSSGPSYDFHAKAMGAYNFVGFIKKWAISDRLTFTTGLAVGDISTLPGVCLAGGTSITYHF